MLTPYITHCIPTQTQTHTHTHTSAHTHTQTHTSKHTLVHTCRPHEVYTDIQTMHAYIPTRTTLPTYTDKWMYMQTDSYADADIQEHTL